jgi:hypothetical protein
MTAQDLALIPQVVLNELSSRTRTDYGNTLVPEKLQVVYEIAGSPGATCPPTVGDPVTND